MRAGVCVILAMGALATMPWAAADCNPPMRPPANQRKFASQAVDSIIASYQPKFKDAQLGQIFANALPNTLDTTVFEHTTSGELAPDTFIITGDITAMWLRDSANQVAPYMRFVSQDSGLFSLISGLVRRQARQVLVDPYANAHQLEGSPPSPHTDDSTSTPAFAGTRVGAMGPTIFERKFEIDTLANFLHLSASFFAAAGKDQPTFGAPVNAAGQTWADAAELVIDTLRTQQASSEEEGGNPPYLFQRTTSQPTDSLQFGRGAPAARTGMIKTGFRPSDDAHTLPFNIPGNAYVVVALREAAAVLSALGRADTAASALALADEVNAGILAFGVVNHPGANGTVLAYEVDGYGNSYFMDDANLPSLLGIPVYGWTNTTDPLYMRTRALLLSKANPYYFSGSVGQGTGGPHDGLDRIWPMSMVARASTALSDQEVLSVLEQLKGSTACTGLMHESINKNSAGSYTRPWFAWANSFFGGLILDLAETRPHLIFA
ncbi:hypothetical protein FNF31_01766 [Cafeteria roenbergensis]|uniref:Glycoside hydrolase family 125 protein n=1 Tax=Cafeteria roenbergensis TaxID=33653 RepID=A0A5A8DKY8_CAFRO|nr:hypothetical protein FNF28_07714 [Cafeteria roenbergensis]KAA0165789.1 hypothetical protein FNF31_01766 [Cafeteria roenbergensis]